MQEDEQKQSPIIGDRNKFVDSKIIVEYKLRALRIEVKGAPIKLTRHIVNKFHIASRNEQDESIRKINDQLSMLFGRPLTGENVRIEGSTISIKGEVVGKDIVLNPDDPYEEAKVPELLASVSEKIRKKTKARSVRTNQERDGLNLFIAPKGSPYLQESPDEELDVIDDKVKAFLNSDNKRSLLLLGDTGSGKSLYCRYLWEKTWETYHAPKGGADQIPQGSPIPLLIDLPQYERPNKDLIHTHLVDLMFAYDLSVPELQAILTQPLICILDSYDEMTLPMQSSNKTTHYINLYRSNKLNDWPNRLKVLTTCRSQTLSKLSVNYESYFYPQDMHGDRVDQFEQWVIRPFRKRQEIDPYIKQYVSQKLQLSKIPEKQWSEKRYHETISKMPTLYDLISNPFLLFITLEVLPSMKLMAEEPLSRLTLYEAYTKRHFGRVANQLKKGHRVEEQDGIEEDFYEFSKELACELYLNRSDKIYYQRLKKRRWSAKSVMNISEIKQENYKRFFDGENLDVDLIRSGCMLRAFGNGSYGFLHDSLREYFLSKCMESELLSLNTKTLSKLMSIKNKNHIFNVRFLSEEKGILDFLVEILNQLPEKKPHWKELLLAIIKESRKREYAKLDKADISGLIKKAASNAITLLNYSNAHLSLEDFSCVDISNADLQGAILDGSIFSKSILKNVNFKNSFIKGVDFRGSNMLGVKFGGISALKEHNNCVITVQFSNDGTLLASAGEDRRVIVWDVRNHEKLIDFENNNRGLIRLKKNRSRVIWDINEGKIIDETIDDSIAHTSFVHSLFFTKDSQYLISAGGDNKIFLINLNSKKARMIKIRSSKLNSNIDGSYNRLNLNGIYSIKTDLCENILAISCGNGQIIIWSIPHDIFNIEEWVLENELFSKKVPYPALDISWDGKFVIAGNWLGELYMYEVSDKKKGFSLRHKVDHPIQVVKYDRKSDLIAIGTWGGYILILKSQFPGVVFRKFKHDRYVSSLSFDKNSSFIISTSGDNTIKMWDIKEAKMVKLLSEQVSSIQCSSLEPTRNNLIASGSIDGIVRIHRVDFNNEQRENAMNYAGTYLSISISQERKQFAIGGWDGKVYLWDIDVGRVIRIFIGHTDCVNFLQFSRCGKYIVSASSDNSVILWDVITGQLKKQLIGHSKRVKLMYLTSKNDYLISIGADNIMCMWKLPGFRLIEKGRKLHNGRVNDINFHFKEKEFVTVGDDKFLRIWCFNDGEIKELNQFKQNDVITCVRISVNGKYIGFGDTKGYVYVAEYNSYVRCNKIINKFTVYHDPIVNIEFSPNNSVMICSSSQKEFSIISNFTIIPCIHRVSGHHGKILDTKFIDNKTFLTCSYDTSIVRWGIKFPESGEIKIYRMWANRKFLFFGDCKLKGVSGLSKDDEFLLKNDK